MASLLTIRERKARWKELEKLISTYNKRHKHDSFQFSLPNKELVFKGIIRVFYERPGCCEQSKCLQVDSQTSSAEIVAKTMEKLDIREDPTNYALYHVNTNSKCDRLIGDSELPLTFMLFYNEKEQEDLKLVLKTQTLLSTNEKRKTLTTPQKRKRKREIEVPKDAITDYGIAALEEVTECEMTLLSKEADKVTEAAKDLVNIVAKNGAPRYPMPSKERLWQYLRPKAALIIMHVKQLVIQATETAGRHCLHQTYLKFVTYHMDIITQNAKEVVLTAKGMGGVLNVEAISKDEAVHKLIVEAEALSNSVNKCRQIIYMVSVSGLLACTLPTWSKDNPLKNDTALDGSITVCRSLIFSVTSASLLLLEAVCERRKDKFAPLASSVINSAQISVETVQRFADNSFLSRYPLKNRLDDVEKLVEQATTDLYCTVKLASSIWAPSGSDADMLLAAFGVLLSSVHYTIAAQCASVLHNATLTGWDLLHHPWVVATFKDKVEDEGIEFVSTSLTTVNEVMSDEESQVDKAPEEGESLRNDTSGFASSEHLHNGMVSLPLPNLMEEEQYSRGGGSVDVLGASSASMLDGEFLDEPDDIFDEKPQKRSRSSSKRGSWATSRRPSEDVIHRASSKSGIAEEATEDELNESTSRRHSLHQDNETDDKESKTTSTAPSHGVDSFDHLNTTADRSIKNASQSLSMGSPSKEVTRKLTQSIRRRQSFDAALNGLKTRPRVDVHRRSSQREVVFNTDPLKRREFSESERQSFSQSGSQTPQQQRMPLGAGLVTGSTTGRRESYHNDRRVKKSPLIQSTRMSRALSATEGMDSKNLEMLKQACIVNKAISKVVEGLLFSITQKAASLELACQNHFQNRFQGIARLISEAAKQITEEVGGMELAFVANDNQELKDSIHRQATPILLATREADAAAAMASGSWCSETVISDLISAVHHVKDLCFHMVSAALKATSVYSQLVDNLGTASTKGDHSQKQSNPSHPSGGTVTSTFLPRNSRVSQKCKSGLTLIEERDDEGLVFMDTPGVKDGFATLHRNKSDLPVVRGGTLTRLVQRLTYHKIVDTDFTDCFLLTFHSFTTPNKLMDALIVRYNIEPPDGLTVEEESQLYTEAVVPIRLRVCHVLHAWINKQFDDFLDSELADRLEKFIDVISCSLPSYAKQLRVLFRRYQLRGLELPRSRLSAKPQQIRRVPSEAINLTNIFGVDPLEMARQLTLNDWDVFKRIRPQECMGCCWESSEMQHLAVNIVAIVDQANDLSLWISGVIVTAHLAELRGQYITYFIKTAKKCYKLKNYNAVFTIMSALTSVAVYRLEASWQHVPGAVMAVFRQLCQLTSEEDNYAAYRQQLSLVVQQPVIPFLGIYLNELAVTEESSPDFLPGQPNLINFHKRRLYALTIRQIHRHQQVAYNLAEVKILHEFLMSLEPPVNENDLYHCSVTAEPKRKS